MKTSWTKWARARVLPFPGNAWTVEGAVAAAEKRLAKLGAVVPPAPDVDTEIERAIELRVNERYNPDGNHPRDTNGRDLVDVWVARAGVVFATRCLIGACSRPTEKGGAYGLRYDAEPWGRLREHLCAASPADRASARELASAVRAVESEIRPAVAYAFVDAAWVAEDLEEMFAEGYGQLCLLAALTDAQAGRDALKRLIDEGPDPDEFIAKYQLVENGFPFMPTLMTRLEDRDADLVLRCCDRAWNKATRKPWLEIAGSLTTAAAKKFVATHGGPGPKKPATKKSATKKPATKKPATKKSATKRR